MGPRTPILVLATLLLFAGLAQANQATINASEATTITIQTDHGEKTIRTDAADTPLPIQAEATLETPYERPNWDTQPGTQTAPSTPESSHERNPSATNDPNETHSTPPQTVATGLTDITTTAHNTLQQAHTLTPTHQARITDWIEAKPVLQPNDEPRPTPEPGHTQTTQSTPTPTTAPSTPIRDLLATFTLQAAPAAAFATVTMTHIEPWLRNGRRLLPLAPGLGLYTRLSREEVLEHETRSAVYNKLRETPGLSMQELADTMDASRSTIRHHVNKLEEMQMVDHVTHGRCRIHFPQGQRVQAIRRHLLSDPTRKQLHDALKDEPASITDLAQALDANPGQIHHHLGKLCDAGLAKRRENGSITYHAAEPDPTPFRVLDPGAE